MDEKRHFIVTGTGRCGTGYTATVLQTIGMHVGHENVYNLHQPPQWGTWWGDCSWLAAPHLHNFTGRIVHLVRNPLAVVNSLQGIGFFQDGVTQPGEYRHYARTHSDVPIAGNSLEQAQQFVIAWNRMIEPYAAYRWHVEQLDAEDISELIDSAGGLVDQSRIRATLTQVPTNVNSRSRTNLGWQDMTPQFRNHAAALGYDTG